MYIYVYLKVAHVFNISTLYVVLKNVWGEGFLASIFGIGLRLTGGKPDNENLMGIQELR